MSKPVLHGNFAPELAPAGHEVLISEDLHAFTAIAPSGVWLGNPSAQAVDLQPESNDRWCWRVATWARRYDFHASTAPRVITPTELPTLLQARPECAEWMLKQMRTQLQGLLRRGDGFTEDGPLSVLQEAQAAMLVARFVPDVKSRIPLVPLAMAQGMVNYATLSIEK